MCLFVRFFGYTLPSYGIMIALGFVVANILATLVIRKEKLCWLDFVIVEAYMLLGAFVGAKLLYVLVSIESIAWDQLHRLSYLNQLMRSGFVFYGGLIGGLVIMMIPTRIHHIDVHKYVSNCIFLVPLVHGFGRIGCFLAGCCYGVEYDGIGAVTYPSDSLAPSGVPLLPIQLIESGLLFVLAFVLYFFRTRLRQYTIEAYLVAYSVLRFLLEFARADRERGVFGCISTSQFISVVILIVTLVIYLRRGNVTKRTEEKALISNT